MEGGDLRAAVIGANEPIDPLLHLAGGLVREGERHDLRRGGEILGQDVGETVHDDPGFSGSGTRDDQKRTVRMNDRLPLARVERFQQRIHKKVIISQGRYGPPNTGGRCADRLWRRNGGSHWWACGCYSTVTDFARLRG